MNELKDIVKSCLENPYKISALATVVEVEGSSFRRPGARMVVLPGRETVGSLGGSLESDVICRAQGIMMNGRAELLSYDTTSEEDALFGVSAARKGTVYILVERFACTGHPAAAYPSLPEFVQNLYRQHRKGVVATVIRGGAPTGSPQVGQRLLLDQNGISQSNIHDDSFKSELFAEARRLMRTDLARVPTLKSFPDGTEVFMEVLQPPPPLIVIGAGFDAVPVVRFAKQLGFHVTVVDARPAYADFDRFPEADVIHPGVPVTVRRKLPLDEQTAVVIMSHNYLNDLAWLKTLLPLPLGYLGLLGSRRRAEQMVQELQDDGVPLTPEQIERLHNPIGLDIGAESPEQAALAMLAEIQAVAANRTGGLRRVQEGPLRPTDFIEQFNQGTALDFLEENLCVTSAS